MDRIDEMLWYLRRALPEVTWDRDAVSEYAPDNVGAVEFAGTHAFYADGQMIAQAAMIDVWLVVTSSAAGAYMDRVQAVLQRLSENDDFAWSLPERKYSANIDQVIWRWRCESDGLEISPERQYAIQEAEFRDGQNQL